METSISELILNMLILAICQAQGSNRFQIVYKFSKLNQFQSQNIILFIITTILLPCNSTYSQLRIIRPLIIQSMGCLRMILSFIVYIITQFHKYRHVWTSLSAFSQPVQGLGCGWDKEIWSNDNSTNGRWGSLSKVWILIVYY